MKVRDLPPGPLLSVEPETTIADVARQMRTGDSDSVAVMSGDRLVGIITERDYARKIVLMSRSSKETPVREIMTSAVMYVRPDQTSEECMALMTENRVRHLPVIDNDKLIGLLSIGDLVKDIISEQRFTIEQLEQYIRGER